jgi:hypothetical protein
VHPEENSLPLRWRTRPSARHKGRRLAGGLVAGAVVGLGIATPALGQVISDPTGRICLATGTDSCSAADVAVASGGNATSWLALAPGGTATGTDAAAGQNASANYLAVASTGSSNASTSFLPWTQVAVSATGPAEVCGATFAGVQTEVALSVTGTATSCAQGIAISGLGNATSLDLAISGTGSATTTYHTGQGAISGTGPANANGSTVALSGLSSASNGGTLSAGMTGASGGTAAISPTGSANGSELAVSGTGNATACGGPFPVALAPMALLNMASATSCPGTAVP